MSDSQERGNDGEGRDRQDRRGDNSRDGSDNGGPRRNGGNDRRSGTGGYRGESSGNRGGSSSSRGRFGGDRTGGGRPGGDRSGGYRGGDAANRGTSGGRSFGSGRDDRRDAPGAGRGGNPGGTRDGGARRDDAGAARGGYEGPRGTGGDSGRGGYSDRRPGSTGGRSSDGERRPYQGGGRSSDGERRPYQGGGRSSDGERRPYQGGDRREHSVGGERRAWTPREGANGSDRPRSERPRTDRSHSERAGRGREKAPWRPTGQHAEFEDEHNGPDLRSVRTRHDDPLIPDDVQANELDKGARIQLKTLEKENADAVARHLVMAARLIDEDAELAHRHAISAARRGGRIAVVRESLAITAYATGDFALALRELRTFRRISGSNDQLPLMVDSERGVGRPDRALELGRSVPRDTLAAPVRVGLAIAMSGARLDLGQTEEALAELEIPELDKTTAFSYSPMLFDAYAEVLEELGQTASAAEWRERSRIAAEALDDDADDDFMTVVEVEDPEARAAYDAAARAEALHAEADRDLEATDPSADTADGDDPVADTANEADLETFDGTADSPVDPSDRTPTDTPASPDTDADPDAEPATDPVPAAEPDPIGSEHRGERDEA